MIEKKLELRKYMFVPYNISDKQKGIQAGHSSDLYGQKFKDDDMNIDFIKNHLTWIILDGGTTNNNSERLGTLNQIYNDILEYNSNNNDKINVTTFYEPDLNDALTAVCFIADERVFNYDDYIDFRFFIGGDNMAFTYDKLKEAFPDSYNIWVNEIMGGKKNAFLRELTKGKKLA